MGGPIETTSEAFSLARFVEDARALTFVAGRPTRFEWLPSGSIALVFRASADEQTGDVAIMGPRTHALFKTPTGVSRAVVLQFKPGWCASLLGASASALANRVVPLADLWGRRGDDLGYELLETRSLSDVIDRIARAIAVQTRGATESSSAQLARRAARLLENDSVRVSSVATKLGVTPRHLRRAFTESIGIGPKDYARGIRLQRAVDMAASSKDWGRIATAAGYFDQAHLIADFRQLVGLTPGAFAARSRS